MLLCSVALEVTISVGVSGDLSVSIGVTDALLAVDTSGLLGTVDGDATNDLLTPLGETLSNNTNEESIYYNFGQKCK